MRLFIFIVWVVIAFGLGLLSGCSNERPAEKVVVVVQQQQQQPQMSQHDYMEQQFNSGYINQREYNDFLGWYVTGAVLSDWFIYKRNHRRDYYRSYEPYTNYDSYRNRTLKRSLKKERKKLKKEQKRLKKQQKALKKQQKRVKIAKKATKHK